MDRAERFGIASFVLGILGFLPFILFPPVGLTLSILALVFGYPRTAESNTPFSKAGFILGIVGIMLHVLLLIYLAVGVLYFLSELP